MSYQFHLGQYADGCSNSHDYRSTATRIDAQLYKDVYDFWLPNAQAVNVATGANQTFALQPILLELVDAGKAKGGNPMGIPKENHQCAYLASF